jgi:hypothetical protein
VRSFAALRMTSDASAVIPSAARDLTSYEKTSPPR